MYDTMPKDRMTLWVNDRRIENFLSYRVESDLYTADDAFSAELAQPETDIEAGMRCQLYINDQLALCDCYKDKIYHDVPEGIKVNVDFLLNTNTLKESVTNYLNSANSTGICYELATIGNTIVVIVREGFLYSLKDNTQKVAFLKDLYETSFNVMGESIASSKPFFLELVDTL